MEPRAAVTLSPDEAGVTTTNLIVSESEPGFVTENENELCVRVSPELARVSE